MIRQNLEVNRAKIARNLHKICQRFGWCGPGCGLGRSHSQCAEERWSPCGSGVPHLQPQKLSDFSGCLQLRRAAWGAGRGCRTEGRTDWLCCAEGCAVWGAGRGCRTVGRTKCAELSPMLRWELCGWARPHLKPHKLSDLAVLVPFWSRLLPNWIRSHQVPQRPFQSLQMLQNYK